MSASSGLTGVILAGGASRRMGACKALLPWGSGTLIEHIVRTLRTVADDVVIVTKDPAPFAGQEARVVTDRLPWTHPAVGLMTGLRSATHDVVFVCACDMPWLAPAVIRHLWAVLGDADAVVPRGPHGLEPLHAVYTRRCARRIEQQWRQGARTVRQLLATLAVRVITPQDLRALTGWERSCMNLNTPEDYDRIRRLVAAGAFTQAHAAAKAQLLKLKTPH